MSVSFIFSGFGSIIQLYPGGGPVRAATACFGFPKSFLSGLYEFPLNKVDSLLNGTFSAEMLSSEPKDNASAEESNGTLETFLAFQNPQGSCAISIHCSAVKAVAPDLSCKPGASENADAQAPLLMS